MFSTINDDSIHSSSGLDVIIKCVDEWLLTFDPICITYQGICANKELCQGTSIIDSRGVAEDSVYYNRLISYGDIKNRIS